MKMLRISDEAHQELRRRAAISGKGLTEFAEDLLLAGKTIKFDEYTAPKKIAEAIAEPVLILGRIPHLPKRTPGDVLKEINSYKEELEEAVKFCQDAETRRQMEKDGKLHLDELWKEYHELKASQSV